MNLSKKFRLYPSQEDEEELNKQLDLCRQVYNHFLEKINESDEIPPRYELQATLPELKEERPKLKQVHSKVLQMVLKQLYDNLKSLSERKKNGHRVGKLRFKGEGWWKTMEYNQSGFEVEGTDTRLDYLKLSKIGRIPIRLHRPIEGKVKGVIIKRSGTGKWFAIFQVEEDFEPVESERKKAVGLDLGILNFAVDSDGRKIGHPHSLEKVEEVLGKEQKNLAKKDKGSNNRERKRIRVAELHELIKNRRMDFLHKLSTAYVENYDVICVEDLNAEGMRRGSRHAKNISDSGWATFVQLLSYKAEKAGKTLVKVDPKNTSLECSECGTIVDKRLWYREHRCPTCGYVADRDYNASRNVLKRGLEKLGEGRAEVTPVDSGTSTLTSVSASSVVEAGSSVLNEV